MSYMKTTIDPSKVEFKIRRDDMTVWERTVPPASSISLTKRIESIRVNKRISSKHIVDKEDAADIKRHIIKELSFALAEEIMEREVFAFDMDYDVAKQEYTVSLTLEVLK